MAHELQTPVSGCDSESIWIRGRELSTEIMGELDFAAAMFFSTTGRVPTKSENQFLNAALPSLIAHGTTSHAVASRLTFASEPESVQGAVASGLHGVGSRSAGAVRSCSRKLREMEQADDTDDAIVELADGCERTSPFGVTGFAGIGHGHFETADPRANELLGIADGTGLAGEHTQVLREIQRACEHQTDGDLPVNVIGALSAVSSDIGLSPIAIQGLAIISRTVGLIAEINEEDRSPMAPDIRRVLTEAVEYTDDPPETD